MNRPNRLATALSTVATAALLAGCAAGHQNRSSLAVSKVDREKVGLATRAQVALSSGQFAAAVEFAERAVSYTPDDAGFRALLANCYFASGRFASAEQAYRDSLTLAPNQVDLVLKLALVQIAQGKNGPALALLHQARNVLDPADYGLAVALAGRADEAVAVLDSAARRVGSDARVRQNLALAYGLAGDWTMARTVAEQDVAPDQVDSRIQQWMAIATPSRPSDQVAMLTGIRPSIDPGQPQALALNGSPQIERYAELAVPQAQPQPQPVQIPEVAPPALPEPMPSPAVAEAEIAPAPVVAEAARSLLTAEATSVEPQVVEAKLVDEAPTSFEAAPEPPKFVAISDTVRRAAKKGRGKSRSVVQLGAYSSPDRVSAAWEVLTKRYPALAEYTPMRAKFDGPKGTVWRLSIKGFASDGEARSRCELLQSRDGNCFVRTVAGDAPVQFASR
ncbi:MAG TPA: tetratricopeptide repeat protein [Sphingomicrobium sp.]|nr:tetratricopeptide repeat protein [Sphingomicrobium sp.]